MNRIRRYLILAVTLAATLTGLPRLRAQQASTSPENAFNQSIERNYTRTSWFPNVAGPYLPPHTPPLSLANSQYLYELIQNGKMKLSLADAISLAVENNLNIAVQRYNPEYAQIDKVRAASGQATRGVTGTFSSNALFSGALGGGISAGTGGFSNRGAGTATGNITVNPVNSVGSFDPVVGFTAGWAYGRVPLINNVLSGVSELTGNTGEYNMFFGQELPTGTSYSVSFGGQRLGNNAIISLYNPEVVTGMTVGIEQNLLNGFGRRANAKFIRIAANDVGIAKDYFEEQVTSTIGQVETDYWTLVEDKRNVDVTQEAVTYAKKLLADNERQVQIGTLAPLDVIQAKSQLATAQQNLIVAQTTFKQQQEVVKTDISKRVTGELLTADIEPTTSLPTPKPGDVPPLTEALRLAHINRPEIDLNNLNLRNESVILKANRNSLLPTLNVYASYTPAGLSGQRVCFIEGCAAPPPGFIPTTVAGHLPGGLGGALSDVFSNRYPDYSAGFVFAVPLRNRAAQADAARALLEEHMLRTQVQQELNTIDQAVRQAEIGVVQGQARVDASQQAVLYAKQQYVDEQKKFQVGESTVELVIQMQNSYTQAEGNLVTAKTAYAQALTQFYEATGTLLNKDHVELVDAMKGQVTRKMPNIPGTPIAPSN